MAALPPPRRVFVAAAGVLAVAVAISVVVAVVGAPLPGDRAVLAAVQGIDALDPVAPPINWLGGVQWYVLISATGLALLLAALPRTRGPDATWALALLGCCTLLLDLDRLLKRIIGSPRPEADATISVTEVQASFGFPSGHVYGDVLMLGAAALVALRFLLPIAAWPIAGIAATVVVLAGLSRMVTGAHWPVDVLGGLLWGLAAVLVALAAAGAAERRVRLARC